MLELLVQRTEINQVPSKFLSEAGLQFRNRRIVPIDAVLGGFQLSIDPVQILQNGRVEQLRLGWTQRFFDDMEPLTRVALALQANAQCIRHTSFKTLNKRTRSIV